MPATVFAVGDFVRRVVDSFLRGDCRGKFLCSRCLVKLTKDHLDRSYTTREVGQVMEDIFGASGPTMQMLTSACAACGRKGLPCLGVPSP